MTDDHKKEIYSKFKKAVNMTAFQIESFLKTKKSKDVGQVLPGETESIGRKSGRRIIKILLKQKSKLTDDDYTHMNKVISYVARHLAQGGPENNKKESKWRYSLMNWGHDPLK